MKIGRLNKDIVRLRSPKGRVGSGEPKLKSRWSSVKSRFNPMTSAAKTKAVLAGLVAAGIAAAALIVGAPSGWAQPKAAEPLQVVTNKATIVRLAGRAQNVIIGDPRVVDVTVENRSMLILFGRSPGETNLIVLDSQNREILSVPVVVAEETNRHVTVTSSAKSGLKEVVYNCAPRCVRSTLKGTLAATKGGTGSVAEAAEAPAPAPAAAPEPAPAPAPTGRRPGYSR